MRKTTTFISLQATTLLLVACITVGLVADCLGRPLLNEKQRAARGNSAGKTTVTATPLHRQLRGRRQTFSSEDLHNQDTYNGNNFPDTNAVESTIEPSPESCYQYASVTYQKTVYEYTNDGNLEEKEVNVTRVERRCCDDWKGDDCNEPPANCYVYANVTYRETVYEYTIDGVLERKEENVTRVERRCCNGWTGENCNKPPESCYQYVTVTYREKVYEYTNNGVLEEKEVNVTRVERRCCDGWTGDNCNERPLTPTPSYNPEKP